MTEWAADYLGKPYRPGACGPDAYDCYGLVADVMDRVYGKLLMAERGEGAAAQQLMRELTIGLWRRKESAEPGDPCVLWHGTVPAHVGIWVGEGMLHALERSGVVLSNRMHLRAMGWKWIPYEYSPAPW